MFPTIIAVPAISPCFCNGAHDDDCAYVWDVAMGNTVVYVDDNSIIPPADVRF